MSEFSPQNLAKTAWAFATAAHVDALLSTALAKVADRRMHAFLPQESANTAWAFATAAHADALLFTALARAV